MKYKLDCRKGIDDLKPEYLFQGCSQGDEFSTNSLEEYKSSKGWMCSLVYPIPITQEEVDSIVKFNKEWNRKYIQELKNSEEFGEIEFRYINIEEDPLFDNNNKGVKESYRYDILDMNKDKKI